MGEMMLAKLANTELPQHLTSHQGVVMQTSSFMLNDREVFLSVAIEDGNFCIYNSVDEFQAGVEPMNKFSIIEIYDVYMARPKANKPGSETHFIIDSKKAVWRFYTPSQAESEDWVARIWEIVKYCQVNKIGFEHDTRSTFLAPPTPPSTYEESKTPELSLEENLRHGSEEVSFSSFTILEQLGEGSFGKVYKVIKKNSREVYAMKVLSKKFLSDNNQLKYAISECKIMRTIRHPFILTLHYAFQTPKNLFIVLEYCPNGDLMRHLSERNRFSEATSKFYMAEVIMALEYLHALDVVYRDLKPENILLDRTGHVRLADFGLAKENVNPLNPAMSFCGSPAYLAPELLTKKGSEKSADVYGLGAMLYEFLTGFPPFFSDNLKDLFKNIRKGNLQFTKTIKPEAQDLIRKLMNQDPNKRPTLSNVKKHPFFKGIDWEQLYLKRIQPPRLGPGWHQVGEDEQFVEPIHASSSGTLLVDRDYNDAKAERVKGFNFSGGISRPE
jgi:protein-serine/threonine kinase